MKSACLCAAFLLFAAASAPCAEPTGERPNFVFFITDDISASDLGCYGNDAIRTPHIDRLAAEGLRFDNAYLTISSCSPSRCSIITGRYPHNTGAAELHTTLPLDQYMFPEALRQAGYYTVLSGKNHMGPATERAFDHISGGKGPGKEADWVGLLKDRPKDQPFFFWFASTDAHRGWQFNDEAPRYAPDEVAVPPFLYDGPMTREDLAGYYHEVSRTDHYVGQLRAELARQGIAENTYFIYMSDNGRPFPRCKTRLYESGIRTPFLIARTGTIRPGVSQSLISAIDIAATVLQLASVPKDPRVQGVSFAPVLDDPAAVTRGVAFAEHNWHVFQAHERMVRFGDWLYIRNAWPERQNLCLESTADFPTGEELWEAEEAGRLAPEQRDVFLEPRPAEEIYHVERDPHQLENLVESEEAAPALDRARRLLATWTQQTGDTVPDDPTNDREFIGRKRRPDHRRGTMPGEERGATNIDHPGPVRID